MHACVCVRVRVCVCVCVAGNATRFAAEVVFETGIECVAIECVSCLLCCIYALELLCKLPTMLYALELMR